MPKNEVMIVQRNVSDLVPYEKNPRNNKKAVKYVKESIKEFGFKVPIVIDKDNVIVAGHTRLLAAKELKMTTVPCIVADDLTEEQIRAYRLVDNKVAEISEWDKDILAGELGDIHEIDMDIFGFILQEEEKEEEIEPELEFSEVLGEEHNYIVLYFDNEVDWLNAESLFGIVPVKALLTCKGKSKGSSKPHIQKGRVVNGAKALEKLRGAFQNNG